MNDMSSTGGGEAIVRYLPSDYEVVRAGEFVICAVTGERIPLDDLRYWSHVAQEPYKDAAASLEGWKRRRQSNR